MFPCAASEKNLLLSLIFHRQISRVFTVKSPHPRFSLSNHSSFSQLNHLTRDFHCQISPAEFFTVKSPAAHRCRVPTSQSPKSPSHKNSFFPVGKSLLHMLHMYQTSACVDKSFSHFKVLWHEVGG